MIAGHFGLAAGAKAVEPRVPLSALMLSTFLLDVIFFILWSAGIESLTQEGSTHAGVIVHAYYTHSLVGALLIALGAGVLAARMWGRRGGLVIASVVISHWLLDLIVHRPDLPIFPGNLGNLPLLGFGVWQMSPLDLLIELALVLGGAYLYYRAAAKLPLPSGGARLRINLASGVTALLLLLLLASDYLGL